MPTRYIRQQDKLYYVMVIDGKYQLNKSVNQPQYVILSSKLNLYEVMYYNFYKAIQDPNYASPALSKQMFIPLSHVVEAGDEVESIDG